MWKNDYVAHLRLESGDNLQSRQTPHMHGAFADAATAPSPQRLLLNRSLADAMNLDSLERGAAFLSGNGLPQEIRPFAMRYGGHQFGQWAGQLGDGRALNIAQRDIDGLPHWLQLKGAGSTAYSRRADGKAVLRSSIREFICSEAMHYLGVPTTRALSLVSTGESVLRDPLYDGRTLAEPGAIVGRVAPSFVRFGHVELHARSNEPEALDQLYKYFLNAHFPQWIAGPEGALEHFVWLADATAQLMAKWQALGFVHGVMNTDNMSMLGLSIDYGPFGWLDELNPGFTPNTTDQGGRYAYGQQPQVALWNLANLAQALLTYADDEAVLAAALESYTPSFEAYFEVEMAAKLGIRFFDPSLWSAGVVLLQRHGLDWTRFFALLDTRDCTDEAELVDALAATAYQATASVSADLQQWLRRLQQLPRAQSQSPVNPRVIPRNYLLQEAILEADQGRFETLNRLYEQIQQPFDVGLDDAASAIVPSKWRALNCNRLSCSS